jgi:hypothetical protein
VSHGFVYDARFWRLLSALDEDLAAEVQRGGCRRCGAVLHSACYPRKPRGVSRAVFGDDYERRLSFCCAREGCRRRATPASVRFLGRRVYVGAMVVLVTALSRGLTNARCAQLRAEFGISDRTLKRWQRWWREVFPSTSWWCGARGRFARPPEITGLPATLLECFLGAAALERLTAVLRFLAPLSTGSEHAR